MVLVETWLPKKDQVTIDVATPVGYSSFRKDRLNKRGGGIAVIYRSSLVIQDKTYLDSLCSSCELACLQFDPVNKCHPPFLLCSVYRPPAGHISKFLDEWQDILVELNTRPNVIIVGDFNLHIDCPDKPDVAQFLNALDMHGWDQHINEVTHECGHILDLVITKYCSTHLLSSTMRIEAGVADHALISFCLAFHRSRLPLKAVNVRKLRSIDTVAFWQDFWRMYHGEFDPQCESDSDMLLNYFENVSSLTLNVHAPIRKFRITLRDNAPWYSPALRKLHIRMRRSERHWRKSRLNVDIDIFKELQREYIASVRHAKSLFMKSTLARYSKYPKKLWGLLAQCTGTSLKAARKTKSSLPTRSASSDEDLANLFGEFFVEKVASVKQSLTSRSAASTSPALVEPQFSECHWPTSLLLTLAGVL
jgi:hypothetical protein